MDELLKLTIDDIEHQIELIKIHKRACIILEGQIAHFGAFVPPHIQMDYNKRQEEINRLMNLVVEMTKKLPASGAQGLTVRLEEKIPERVIISDSGNVLVNTKINAGGDVIILHITSQ